MQHSLVFGKNILNSKLAFELLSIRFSDIVMNFTVGCVTYFQPLLSLDKVIKGYIQTGHMPKVFGIPKYFKI